MTCCFRRTVGSLLLLLATTAGATDFDLYYLGGQSNMDGYGYVAELPESQRQEVDGAWIFHGNPAPDAVATDGRGLWAPLRAGHGVGFKSNGETNSYSDRFGVELSFARRMQELRPGRPLAIIKYSRGGTSIAIEAARHFGCWDPDFSGGEGAGEGINQYDHFLAAVRQATGDLDIDGDGEPDRLVPRGIVWMQGESDAQDDPEIAAAYQANLKRLIDLIRASLRADDLPVAIGRISDSGQDADGKIWNFGDVVRAAQQQFVERAAAAALVASTDGYGYSDKWHYDTAGYVDLGGRFAEALVSIEPDAGGH